VRRVSPKKRRISLALQGGGAHGAFTWGVLDRLLDEPGLEIAAISGTSAGALNAAALKAGLRTDGAAGAKAALADLWDRVANLGDLHVTRWIRQAFPMAAALGRVAAATLPVSPTGIAAQVYTPYAWGPFWQNPLHDAVAAFDFTRVCGAEGPELHVSATNVRSGKIRIFTGQEITPATLLASACLPTVFQAIELEDPATGKAEVYWDGGFTGNPALFPLYERHLPDDIIIVSINPFFRAAVPVTPVEIQGRINEISFNSALLGELRAVHFVKQLIAEGRMPKGAKRDPHIHIIADEVLMNELGAMTKLSPSPRLLERLRTAGHAACEAFLAEHKEKIGHESSADLCGLFG
jgi:NTE family protein